MTDAHSAGSLEMAPTLERVMRAAILGVLLLLVGAGACARRSGAPSSPASPDEAQEGRTAVGPVALAVENLSQYNVTIYAVRGSLRQRVGSVAGTSRAEMVIPPMFTDDRGGLALQVLQLGGPQRYVSDAIVPQQGDRLRLTVQVRIASSSLVVE